MNFEPAVSKTFFSLTNSQEETANWDDIEADEEQTLLGVKENLSYLQPLWNKR